MFIDILEVTHYKVAHELNLVHRTLLKASNLAKTYLGGEKRKRPKPIIRIMNSTHECLPIFPDSQKWAFF